MTAPVRIEAEAWSDLRFATLARLLKLADLDHALIKVARIWSWQAEHYTPEEPTYIVDGEIIESALGPGGPEAMVKARLAEPVAGGLSLGYPSGYPGGSTLAYRIRGTEGRIEWLYQRRTAALKGGQANKRRLADKPKPVAKPTDEPTAKPPDQPNGKPKPSPLPLPLVPEEDSLPRAIPPSTELSTKAAPTPHASLHNATLQRLDALRLEIARRYRLPGVIPLPAHPTGSGDLSARIRENPTAPALIDHVFAVAEAEADGLQSAQHLTLALFTERSWRRLLGMSPDDARRAAEAKRMREERAGPRSNGSRDEQVLRMKNLSRS